VVALQLLASEFAITVTNGDVWLAIGLALLLGGGCLAFGTWVARTVGLLKSDAPAGETLGVGLAAGLMVLAAWWAAIWSGGRSSFTPVAVGFAIAIGLAVARRLRPQTYAEPQVAAMGETAGDTARSSRHRSMILTALAGGVFVVAVALLYGSTIAPSPRDGVQPVEFNDEAFYAILGRDLAATGTETHLPASGFSDLPGVPTQMWYHWAELWLASAVITMFGTVPMAARYFVVLPIVLLAAAALTGTLVRRVGRTPSRRAFLFGFLVCLFLAPVPLIPGPFFSSWAVGMIFGITLYGLGAVAGLLALFSVAVLSGRTATWALAGFVGSAIAFILPAHVVVAALALVGLGSIWAIRVAQSVIATRRLPSVSAIWVRILMATAAFLVATVVWGMLTGHSQGGSSPSSTGPSSIVSPFNASWRASVAITVLGAGAFFAILVVWFLRGRERPVQADLYLGTMLLLFAGAIAWGARLGEFTMFYLFFGGIAVFATPVAAVAVWTLWERLRATKHLRLAVGLAVLCAIQLELGVVNGVLRLQAFGPQVEEVPISVSLIASIKQLPSDAKLAYACRPFDESGFGVPRLLSIDAHTGRRVVPMCFEAEVFAALIGSERSVEVPNSSFLWAPQRALYPDAEADPSSEAVADFLKDHGIGYIYTDAMHPNSLVDNAVPVATSGDAEVLRVP
jgi:hypothetical protein